MKSYETHNGTLYDYTAGTCVGVLVKENVMRKLVRLQHEHLEKVKRVLSDGADKGDVFPSMWTLHYPNGKQVTVKYIDTSASVLYRIKNATTAEQPVPHDLVFIANSMDEAKRMADARHEALGGGVE